MKIAIVGDTNSGITKEEARNLGIYLVHNPILIDGTTFYEESNITEDELIEALESGKNITTSQPSIGDLIDIWNQAFSDGYDYVIYIPVSSYLSSSYATAYRLSLDFDGRVLVVDNHQIAVILRNSIMNAKILVDKGFSAEEIKIILEKDSKNSFMYFTVNDLKYIGKSGRVSNTMAVIGNLLSIKPILTVKDGVIEFFSKVRGNISKCELKMIDYIKSDIVDKFNTKELSNFIIGITGVGLSRERIENLKNLILDSFKGVELFYNSTPFTLSVHTGKNSEGIGVSKKLSI